MKNIYLIATDKPSRLSILNNGKLNFGAEVMSSSNSKLQHIYITNSEEIKEGDWVVLTTINNLVKVEYNLQKQVLEAYNKNHKKIILTTDQDLIKDGVQAINNEFLEWFVKNPSCESVEVKKYHQRGDVSFKDRYNIIIPQEEPNYNMKQEILDEMERLEKEEPKHIPKWKSKQETLEETAERLFKVYSNNTSLSEGHYDYMMDKEDFKEASLEIVKWQEQRMSSENNPDYEKIEQALMEMRKTPMTFVPDERKFSEQLKAFEELFNYAWTLAQFNEEYAKLNEIRETFKQLIK
jgi:translation initiation factor 2 beta subunit (eIF-2beta)/eIF-5